MKKAIIFNIQRYSVHDGEGIRTNFFLKGCPLRCKWCSNPESQKREIEFEFVESDCMGCRTCVSVCPQQARISPTEVEKDKCRHCMKCAKFCPKDALKAAGEEKSIDELLEEVEKDLPFFANSDGGVTLSGGEVLMWTDFASELIDELHSMHLHVACETCGYAPWENAVKVFDKIDLVLYDLKQMNSGLHKKFTGVGNELILENARKLAKLDASKIVFRIPLIGNVNAYEENIRAAGTFAAELGVKRIDLLPYHEFGVPKYEKLGREYECEDFFTPDEEKQQEFKGLLEDMGIAVTIGG